MVNEQPFIYIGQSEDEIPKDVFRVIVDPSVKEIGARAFKKCTRLMNVELCDGLELIDREAFSGCTSLKQISIPSSVKKVGSLAFYYCKRLTNVELSDGLESIERCAFVLCSSLQQIIIPSSVKVIGGEAFEFCNR
jgi:hypothetical protein